MSKINLLTPGMTTEQVKAVLGTPLRTDFREGQLVWGYMLTYAGGGMGLSYYLHIEHWHEDRGDTQAQMGKN